MGEAIKLGGGGSTKVKNGTLQSCYAATRDPIPSNTFIERGYSNLIWTPGYYYGPREPYLASDGEHVKIAYCCMPASGGEYEIRMKMFHVDGYFLEEGEDYFICSVGGNTAYEISCIDIDNNRVLITYREPDVAVYAVVATFNGSTVTVGASFTLYSADDVQILPVEPSSLLLLDDGRVLLQTSYLGGTSYSKKRIYEAILLSVDGDTITEVNRVELLKKSGYYGRVAATKLRSGKILTALGYARDASSTSRDGDTYVYLVTVSETTISFTEEVELPVNSSNVLSVVEVSDNQVIVSVGEYVTPAVINNDTITVGTALALPTASAGEKIFVTFEDNASIIYEDTLGGYFETDTWCISHLSIANNTAQIISTEALSSPYSTTAIAFGIQIPNTSKMFLYVSGLQMVLYTPFDIGVIPSATQIDGLTAKKVVHTDISGKIWLLEE